jgi:hypothetical protein
MTCQMSGLGLKADTHVQEMFRHTPGRMESIHFMVAHTGQKGNQTDKETCDLDDNVAADIDASASRHPS